MMKKIITVLSAAIMCVGLSAVSVPYRAAEGTYKSVVDIDLGGKRKSISPYIYGINEDLINSGLTVNAVRQGDLPFSTYNWENNFCYDEGHRCSDSLVSNYSKELAALPGACPLYLSDICRKYGVSYKAATVPMMGRVAADGNGSVELGDEKRWKQMKAFKNAPFTLEPDTSDDNVYADEYINYIVSKLGDAGSENGINGYFLDESPDEWAYNNQPAHPDTTTCSELIGKTLEYAAAIKSVDPKADVFGPSLSNYYVCAQWDSAPDINEIKNDNGEKYKWFIEYYLDEMRRGEEKAGKRLLDVLDIKYFPMILGTDFDHIFLCNNPGHKECAEARMQAPRTLYEEGYQENDMFDNSYFTYFPLLPKINEVISEHYPGTKLSVSDYNFGGEQHISGAIAEADALGAFAMNDVYFATRYSPTKQQEDDYARSAMNLYTNYDGNGLAFGSILVPAKTSDSEKSTAYAAVDDDKNSRVTLILTNKDHENTMETVINLKNSRAVYSSASVYGITKDSSDIKYMKKITDFKDNTFKADIPPLSVILIDIRSGSEIIEGDVNDDGVFDIDDMLCMQKWIVRSIPGVPNEKAADILPDGRGDVFDVCLMRRKLAENRNVFNEKWSFERINDQIWKIADGAGGKKLSFTVNGEPECIVTLEYSYRDTLTDEIMENILYGSLNFPDSGKCEVTFTLPENAVDVQLILYEYCHTIIDDDHIVFFTPADPDGLDIFNMTVSKADR